MTTINTTNCDIAFADFSNSELQGMISSGQLDPTIAEYLESLIEHRNQCVSYDAYSNVPSRWGTSH